MLHLIPAGLHQLALRVAHRLRSIWWRVARPDVAGCRVIAEDAVGRILLVRHSYGSRLWMLPGGGIGRNEDILASAVRELAEETGCRLNDPRIVASVVEPLHGARNHVHIVRGTTLDRPRADCREIIAAEFHAPQQLPAGCSPGLRRALDVLLRTAPTAADHP